MAVAEPTARLRSAGQRLTPLAGGRRVSVAAVSGHPEVAPFASAVLGGKLLELGQPGPARRGRSQLRSDFMILRADVV
ncbi:MAG: hypothetical protein JWL68_848 [Actinomycetia bacterium]|nr:hypothetical protein [Actinomycetes bacterium]